MNTQRPQLGSPNYHLPEDTYWACNSRYNGISQMAKFTTDHNIMTIASRSRLKNQSISKTVLKQLV